MLKMTQESAPEEPVSRSNNLRSAKLSVKQKNGLIASVCIVRYLLNVNNKKFTDEIYRKVLAIIEPYRKDLELDREPSYDLVYKIWKTYTNRGLLPRSSLCPELGPEQRSILFEYICVSAYKHTVRTDNIESINVLYKETISLLKPHLIDSEFDLEPSYETVYEIWQEFAKRGLILPRRSSSEVVKVATNRLSTRDDETIKTDTVSESIVRGWKVCFVMLIVCIIYTKCFGPPSWLGLKQEHSHDQLTHTDYLGRQSRVRNLIENIASQYPSLNSTKHIQKIRARLGLMTQEVSILLLLGRLQDNHCIEDDTYCIGKALANVTGQFGYINARDSTYNKGLIQTELSDALDKRNDAAIIDSLESLSGNDVMSLFSFVDKVESNRRRRGLLLLMMYTGRNLDKHQVSSKKDAEIVENLLFSKWSEYVRSDTLRSLISRITSTIIKTK